MGSSPCFFLRSTFSGGYVLNIDKILCSSIDMDNNHSLVWLSAHYWYFLYTLSKGSYRLRFCIFPTINSYLRCSSHCWNISYRQCCFPSSTCHLSQEQNRNGGKCSQIRDSLHPLELQSCCASHNSRLSNHS